MQFIDDVMLYSGGLDSTVLLYMLKPRVKALLFNYGQRHKKELERAMGICDVIEVPWKLVDLWQLRDLIGKGSQTGSEDVPLGHYAEDSMKATIVPNRNMIMISIAVGHAVTIGARNVYIAAHAGDHAIYPDCRPEFIDKLNEAILIGNAWTPVRLQAPFIDKTKADIVKLGYELSVPFERTWSCYQGRNYHCGKCGTCVERKEAFKMAGVMDATTYES